MQYINMEIDKLYISSICENMVSVKYKMYDRPDNILVLLPKIILFHHIKPH